MKENFFKSLKENVKNAFSFQDDDDYYEDDYVDEEPDDYPDEPMNEPAPKRATPIVPTVVHELPASSETTAQSWNVRTMNTLGWISFNPYQIIVGTIPESIQVAVSAPMERSMIIAELVDLRLSPTDSSNRLQGIFRPYMPIRAVTTAAPKIASCEGPLVSSSPKTLTPIISRTIRVSTGTRERRSPGFFMSEHFFHT